MSEVLVKLQCGFLYLDGKEAAVEDLGEVLGEFAAAPAETSGELLDGPLGMAYRGLQITLEEENEQQPLRDGSFAITFDGRLDNREELGRRLGLNRLQEVSDPALVLCAYQKFGDKVLEQLIGEFALVLWCGYTRTLLFVRSESGARPLYYVRQKRRLMWSSDFAHLVRVSGVDLAVNEDYLVEYLYSQPRSHHSALKGVEVALPGKALRFVDGLLAGEGLLWNVNNVQPVSYKTDAEYEEHFRSILAETLHCALRAKGVVFSELSGGLDSSTLVLMGDQVLESQSQSKERLQSLSCVFEQSQSSDESYFIRKVEEYRRVRGVHLSENDQGLTLGLRDIEFTGAPNPLNSNRGRVRMVPEVMGEAGARILFSGEGGDHVFWSGTRGAIPVANEIWRGDLVGMHRQCKSWSRIGGLPYWRLLAMSFRMAMETWIAGRWRDEEEKIKTVLTPAYQARFEEIGPARASYRVKGSPGFLAQFHRICDLGAVISAGCHHIYRGIYVSFPYTYRPLVEFCLGVPTSQFLRDGATRSLMRRALGDILPVEVRRRRGKGSPSECFLRLLQREWDDIGEVGRWELCRREVIRNREMYECLKMMRAGRDVIEFPLIRICSLERWLRSLNCVAGSVPREGMVFAQRPVVIGQTVC